MSLFEILITASIEVKQNVDGSRPTLGVRKSASLPCHTDGVEAPETPCLKSVEIVELFLRSGVLSECENGARLSNNLKPGSDLARTVEQNLDFLGRA